MTQLSQSIFCILIKITLLRVIPMTFIHFVTGKYSGILSDIFSGIRSGILSGISSGILPGISSGRCSGISSGRCSGISSGISSGICSGISSGIPSGILSGISSGILSDILSDILSGILSGIPSGILSGISSNILSGISSGTLCGISFGVDTRGWGPAGIASAFDHPYTLLCLMIASFMDCVRRYMILSFALLFTSFVSFLSVRGKKINLCGIPVFWLLQLSTVSSYHSVASLFFADSKVWECWNSHKFAIESIGISRYLQPPCLFSW